jgi:hypothetical protein
MINIQQEREKGDLQGLSHELRRSLNEGLKQFCITSGSSVIKHATKLKGEERGGGGGMPKEIPQVEIVESKREGERMTKRENVFPLKKQS